MKPSNTTSVHMNMESTSTALLLTTNTLAGLFYHLRKSRLPVSGTTGM